MICLLPNCCFLSETSRMLEIHRALVARGAGVCVATHGGPTSACCTDAGVAYDLVGPGVDAGACAEFVRSMPGIGPPDQSMWSDDEIRTYVAVGGRLLREHGVESRVTGWTLTALLSTRVAGIPLVTEHAGSFMPPVFERGLLPAPSTPVGMPLERWLPESCAGGCSTPASPGSHLHQWLQPGRGELGVEGVPSFPALLLGDLTLVTDVPEVLGVSARGPRDVDAARPERYRPGTRLRYTGPMYAQLAVPMPERVERFLAGPRPDRRTSRSRRARPTSCATSWQPCAPLDARDPGRRDRARPRRSRGRATSASPACCRATRSCRASTSPSPPAARAASRPRSPRACRSSASRCSPSRTRTWRFVDATVRPALSRRAPPARRRPDADRPGDARRSTATATRPAPAGGLRRASTVPALPPTRSSSWRTR